MLGEKKINKTKQENLFTILMFRFIPYWPLFVLLLILSFFGAYTYLKFTTPLYQASAALIIKDAQKGITDVKLIDYSDAFSTKKIVENEIEVLKSKSLMRQVVDKLKLYAPVFEKRSFKFVSAYLSSPVIVEVKDPEQISDTTEILFSFDAKKNEVLLGRNRYPLNQWINTPYATFRFIQNKNFATSLRRNYFISFVNPREAAMDLVTNLSVEPTNKLSSVINLYYTDEVPARAEDILNELITSYNEAAVNNKNALAANTLSFVEDRLKYLAGDLDTIEKKIQRLKSEKGIINLSEQGSLFLKNVADNDQKIAELNMQLAALDQVEKYVISKDNRAGIVPSTLGVNDPVLSQLLQKLYDTEIQVEKVKRSTGENNPIITSLNDQIEQIRPGILENIKNQRISLLSTRNNLSTTNTAYSSVLQGIPRKEQELLEITRQQSIKSNVYNFLLEKREETALTNASAASDTRVIDMAESTGIPVQPQKNIVFFIASVIAVIAGILFVCFKEVLNKKILFRSEIEDMTDVPIAGEVMNVRQKKTIAVNNPKTLFIAEQFRHLRTALGLYGSRSVKRKILVTSSISGEGKSFISLNLAASLALAGKKVVLLDFDLRNPNITNLFDQKGTSGITDYLNGDIDPWEIINGTSYNNLYLVPAGSTSINPIELLLNANLDNLFTFLQGKFDYIIIDASPIDPVTDAYVLSEYCDTTLFVIRHAYTPKTFVQLLDYNNKIKSLKDLQIVFNGVKSRGFVIGSKGFGFGQGYGYEYVYKDRYAKALPQSVKLINNN